MYYCLSRCFLFDPFQCCFAVFSAPLYFFPRDRWHPKGEFPFFSKTKKRGLKVVSCAKFAYYSECKSGFSHFPSFFVFGYGYDNNLFDVQVNCFHFGRQNSDVKAYVTTTVWYLFADSNRNTNISVSLFPEDFTRKARKPYHILESHLESLLWSEFCWVFISSKR